MMKIVLLLLLLLADLPLISSGQGVTYCVKPNTTATCGTEDPCQQCQTLQDYLDNVTDTTINLEKDLTIIFMDGRHIANFGGKVTVFAPTLNITAKSKTSTVTLISACRNIFNKGGIYYLSFKGTHFSMENFNMTTLTPRCGSLVQIPSLYITISAIKLVLSKCTFLQPSNYYNFGPVIAINIDIAHATDIII